MKKVFTLLFFVNACSLSFGQIVKTKWSEPNKDERKASLFATCGSFNQGLYSIFTSTKSNEFFIVKYDGNGKILFNKELTVAAPANLVSDANCELKNVLLVKNTLFLFTSFYNKSTDTKYLFVNTVSKDRMLNKDLINLDIVTDSKKKGVQYSFVLSDDSTKICIYNPVSTEKNEKEKLSFHVIDLQMKNLWNHQIELPYLHTMFTNEKVKIDNEGNVFIAGNTEMKSEGTKRETHNKYLLFSYLWNTNETKEYEIELGDKIVKDFYFSFDNENNIRAAGFYSLKKTGGLKGYYYMTIDNKNKTVSNKITKEFNAAFLKKISKTEELDNMNVRQLCDAENGSINIAAEQNYTYTETYQSKRGTVTDTHFVSNKIIVINMKADGTYNWGSVIFKKQDMTSASQGIYSIIIPHKNSIFVAYNDVAGNTKIKEEAKLKKLKKPGKTEMVLAKIDEKGKVTRQLIPCPDPKTAGKSFMLANEPVQLSSVQYAFVCGTFGKPDYRFGIFNIK